MNKNEFAGLVRNPYRESPVWDEIPALSARFPYCSMLKVLNALKLYRGNDSEFNSSLKTAAAYSISRKRLKEIFEKADSYHEEPDPVPVTAPEPGPETVSASPVVNNPEIVTEEGSQPQPPAIEPVKEAEPPAPVTVVVPEPRIVPTREELIRRIHKRLEEIENERREKAESDQKETESAQELTAQPEEEVSESENKKLSKEEIIEKFIREEPRISPPRTSFFSPSELATRSNSDDDEIVSETLARLYSEQGNKVKAIRIYQKLSLLFPEKRSYFAAQIEKLNQ